MTNLLAQAIDCDDADQAGKFAAMHIEQGLHYLFHNDFHTSLVEFDQALQIKESGIARYNRTFPLLCMGRYREGFRAFDERWRLYPHFLRFTENSKRIIRELPRWSGDPGHHVVLLGEAGFGDTIMFLRLVPLIRAMAGCVSLDVQQPVERLAAQLAPVGGHGADCWLSMFDILLHVEKEDIPVPPYLAAANGMWGRNGKMRVGICWDSNSNHNVEHYNQTRSVPLDLFLELLPFRNAELYSLQGHGQAQASERGISVFEYRDFTDVASVAASMDVIVSIDSAALHVAGAIGHPRTYAVLPWTPTWRWLSGNIWYPDVKLCPAKSPGDWRSAMEMINCEE